LSGAGFVVASPGLAFAFADSSALEQPTAKAATSTNGKMKNFFVTLLSSYLAKELNSNFASNVPVAGADLLGSLPA